MHQTHHASLSLSNVIVADDRFTSFHQYLRYSHKGGTIVFGTPSTIIWAYSHIARMVSASFSLFEQAVQSTSRINNMLK